MIARLIVPLAFAAFQMGAAYFTVGRPDLEAARVWTTTEVPTTAAGFALVQIILWAMVAGGVTWSTVVASGPAASAVDFRRRKKIWALLIMVVGLLILAAGTGHHFALASVSMSGGSIEAAQNALAR